MEKSFKGKFIPKHMTAAEWNDSDYVPDRGEIIIYDADEFIKSPRLKCGDGQTPANTLSFMWALPTYTLTKDKNTIILKDNYGNKTEVEDDFVENGDVNLSEYVTREEGNTNYASAADLKELRDLVNNLTYQLPKINSFEVTPLTVASDDEEVIIRWSVSKGTNNYNIDLSKNNVPLKFTGSTASSTGSGNYKLQVTDITTGQSIEASRTVILNKKPVYYGVIQEEYEGDEAFLTSINEAKQVLTPLLEFQPSGQGSNVEVTIKDDYSSVYFMFPLDFGTPKFEDTLGEYEFNQVAEDANYTLWHYSKPGGNNEKWTLKISFTKGG